jgi:hypothetical protein
MDMLKDTYTYLCICSAYVLGWYEIMETLNLLKIKHRHVLVKQAQGD